MESILFTDDRFTPERVSHTPIREILQAAVQSSCDKIQCGDLLAGMIRSGNRRIQKR